MTLNKNDYLIGGLAGFFTGIFAIPVLYSLAVAKNYLGTSGIFVLIILPPVVAILWALGVWLGGFLSKWISIMSQFGKYAAVGFLNTAIDFGILNILSLLTGITSGFIIGGVNIPGFLAAATNSYFWNKLWVFKTDEAKPLFADFLKFAVVTVLGVLLNSGIVIVLTTFLHSPLGLEPITWLNVSKVAASIFSLLWNFLGYKFFVFRSRNANVV